MTATHGASGRDPDPGPDLGARRTWRIAWGGTLVLGGGLTVASAAAGAEGSQGVLWFTLGALLATLAATAYAVVTGVLDTLRGRPVGRRRVIAAVVLGVLSFLLVPTVIGLAGGGGT